MENLILMVIFHYLTFIFTILYEVIRYLKIKNLEERRNKLNKIKNI
jgi:hypothetical protein